MLVRAFKVPLPLFSCPKGKRASLTFSPMNFVSQNKQTFLFYFLAIGIAYGLGNLWRFPYIVAKNQGGAFVLLYIFITFSMGLPLFVADILLSHLSQSSSRSISPFESHFHFYWKFIWKVFQRLSKMITFIVFCYYTVIGSWVLFFFTYFLFFIFLPQNKVMEDLPKWIWERPWLSCFFVLLHLCLIWFMDLKRKKNQPDKWFNYLLVFFVVFLLFLVWQTLSLPSSREALRFFFYPDLTQLKLSSFSESFSHVCFTLGTGMGISFIFKQSYLSSSHSSSSSYRPMENISSLAFRVTSMDVFAAIMGGFLAFPVLWATSLSPEQLVESPFLFFTALSQIFIKENSTYPLQSILFFLFLYISALAGSTALFHVIRMQWKTSFIKTTFQRKKGQKQILKGIHLLFNFILYSLPFVLPFVIVILYPLLHSYQLDLIKWMDSIIIHWLLPVLVWFLCMFLNLFVKREQQKKLLINPHRSDAQRLFAYWSFLIRWIIPFFIPIALLLKVIEGIQSGSFF